MSIKQRLTIIINRDDNNIMPSCGTMRMNWVNAREVLRAVSITEQTCGELPPAYTPAWTSPSRFPISDMRKRRVSWGWKPSWEEVGQSKLGEPNNSISMLWVVERQYQESPTIFLPTLKFYQ